MSPSDQLTDVAFWDSYWAGCPLPSFPDSRFSFDRLLMRKFREILATVEKRVDGGSQAKEALEIGCAPGKWLAFLHRELGYKPSGIEYSPAGVEATKRNLDLLKLEYGRFWTGDFFAIPPEPRFDLVYSLGFIEHFEDVGPVVARHLAWVKPGGLLVLGVPNFRGAHGFFQGILDPGVLSRHNLRIMSPESLRRLGERAGGEVVLVERAGSFEAALPIRRPGLRGPGEILAKAALRILEPLRHAGWFENVLHKRVSCYLIGVFRR